MPEFKGRRKRKISLGSNAISLISKNEILKYHTIETITLEYEKKIEAKLIYFKCLMKNLTFEYIFKA